MNKNSIGNSKTGLEYEELSQLIERGRTLHDRAVFDALVSLKEKIRSLVSLTAGGGRIKYQGPKGVCSQ